MKNNIAIEINTKVMHGEPVIAGTRIPVYAILDLIAAGYTFDDIIKKAYPQLNKEQIKAAVEYANAVIKNEEVLPIGSSK